METLLSVENADYDTAKEIVFGMLSGKHGVYSSSGIDALFSLAKSDTCLLNKLRFGLCEGESLWIKECSLKRPLDCKGKGKIKNKRQTKMIADIVDGLITKQVLSIIKSR